MRVSKATKSALTELDKLWATIDSVKAEVLNAVPKNAITVQEYMARYKVSESSALRALKQLAHSGTLKEARAYTLRGHKRVIINIYMK
jgi:ribosomal protein S25